MAMSEAARARLKQAVRHPVTWVKGADLPEEQIRPWEGVIQFFGEALKGFMDGFREMKDRLYLGLGEGKIPPNLLSVSLLSNMALNIVSDPMIGAYMDRKSYAPKVLRWVMRFNATFSPLNILVQCLHLGLTPMQRVILWTVMSFFANAISATNAVSESKLWAGITPHSKQRGVIQLCKTLGNQLSQGFASVPVLFMGLKDVLHITDYQIMVYGAVCLAPLAIFARWLPSFAKQRVDFTKNAEDAGGEEAEAPPTMRETIGVVKHNPWFITKTALDLLVIISPNTDQLFLYRFLLPKMKLGGKEIGSELIFFLKNFLVAVPGTILQPFALWAIKLFKGELQLMRAKVVVEIIATLLKYLVGYKTFPRLMFMFTMEMVRDIVNRWNTVAQELVNYQMFDYVEWKTGLRSEGVSMTITNFISKIIRANMDSVVGNAVLSWTKYQGFDIPKEKQPERFIKSIWPLMHLEKIFDGILWAIALFRFRFPADRAQVEAELIERRALQLAMDDEQSRI